MRKKHKKPAISKAERSIAVKLVLAIDSLLSKPLALPPGDLALELLMLIRRLERRK